MSLALDASTPARVTLADRRRPVVLVLLRELRAHRRTFLAWALPLAGLVALTVALHPSIAKDGELLAAKLSAMPESVRQAFGMTLVDFSAPASYLATNFITFTLTACLFAGTLGATLVSKEEAFHTAELLLALPVSRTSILAGKAAALGVFVVALHAVLAATALGTFVLVSDGGDIQGALVLQLYLGSAAVALCLGGAAMLVATLVRQARAASGAALGVVFGTYLLGIVSALAPPAAPLKYLSPYELVAPAAIVEAGGLAAWRVVLLVALAAAFAAGAIHRWNGRDIRA